MTALEGIPSEETHSINTVAWWSSHILGRACGGCLCCSIESACVLACSTESLEPAPTEEGYYLAGQIEKVLSELQEEKEVLQPRRYSRSFSEPNLFQRAMLVGAHPEASPCLSCRKGALDPDHLRCCVQSGPGYVNLCWLVPHAGNASRAGSGGCS